MHEEFYTFREYMKKESENLSPSEEDYMEMIYRLSLDYGFTRVNDLAQALNVQPPSVSKMIQKLAEQKYINYEKYGVIMLSERGIKIGKALLSRHNIVEEFLKLLGVKDGLLEETEKIEHTINNEILVGIKDLICFFKENGEVNDFFQEYRKQREE